MNSKQRRCLADIFASPTKADIPWSDIESLLRATGATMTQGAGSRVRAELHSVKAVFHMPHPKRQADKGTVESVRDFLERAGVTP